MLLQADQAGLQHRLQKLAERGMTNTLWNGCQERGRPQSALHPKWVLAGQPPQAVMFKLVPLVQVIKWFFFAVNLLDSKLEISI